MTTGGGGGATVPMTMTIMPPTAMELDGGERCGSGEGGQRRRGKRRWLMHPDQRGGHTGGVPDAKQRGP